jgi:hypothetical protein
LDNKDIQFETKFLQIQNKAIYGNLFIEAPHINGPKIEFYLVITKETLVSPFLVKEVHYKGHNLREKFGMHQQASP